MGIFDGNFYHRDNIMSNAEYCRTTVLDTIVNVYVIMVLLIVLFSSFGYEFNKHLLTYLLTISSYLAEICAV